MSRFNTNNPLDSGHLNDFEDNVKNLDQAVNSVEETWVDRFGRNRLSMFGSEENARAILNKAKLSETRAASSASNASASAANAVAVVTGGTASLTPQAGRIPLANSEGKISAGWIPLKGETGYSSEVGMTQKAITEALNNLGRLTPYTGNYGIQWDSVNDTYQRLGSMNYTAIQSLMKRCVLNTDGSVNYFLHPQNSRYKEDGSFADLSGADGNVMVQIPKFFVRFVSSEAGLKSVEVSLQEEEGFVVHPAFIKGGVEVDYRYYRAYKATRVGGTLMSVSDTEPTRSTSIVDFRNQAEANGVGWHLVDWNLNSAVLALCIIEIGTLDTQSVLGDGNTAGSDNYGRITGVSNLIGNGSSDTSTGNQWMSYRGIEDLYAGVWETVDGINIRDLEVFLNGDYRTFESNKFDGGYVSTGISLPAASSSYIKDLSFSIDGFIPIEIGGSSATYAADAVWSSVEGNRVIYKGGLANSGRFAGGFCLAANPSSGFVYSYGGAGIAF